jgi:5-(carboxyamino)imidazole ribonucleotide mutase
MPRATRTVPDPRVRRLIWRYVRAGVMEDGRGSPSEKGVPQGGLAVNQRRLSGLGKLLLGPDYFYYAHRMKKFRVGIVMGSDSDLPVMQAAADTCAEFGVPCEIKVVSAHRTPDDMARYGRTAAKRGLQVIIAGAGGAAHLPGMLASHTTLPVIGVPVESKYLKGLDSLLSIVQMPAGIPVATVAINNARNAGLLAISILGLCDAGIRDQLISFRKRQAASSRAKNRTLNA